MNPWLSGISLACGLGLFHAGKFYLDSTGNGSWDRVAGGDTFRDFGIRAIEDSATPIVGDWDGDGDDTIGFYVPSQNKWWLKNDLADGWTGVTGFNFGVADPMDPVVGDWDGDGDDTVGGYVPSRWRWFLKDDQVDGWSSVTRIRFGVTASYEVLSGDWE